MSINSQVNATKSVSRYRAVGFQRSTLQCAVKCTVGCSSEVVLSRVASSCPLLRRPLVGIDGIRHINAPVARLHLRSVHRRVLTACGSSVSPMHAKLSCSVRRQVLTASGSSVSSLLVRLSCTVHRQVQTPGLCCTVSRAMPCCHVVSPCSSVLLPSALFLSL